MKIGILPLGRPTFDVAYAEEKLAAMLAALDATGCEIVGPRVLLFDADATRAAMAELHAASVDQVLLLQVTFTDASMTVAAARAFDAPLSIWAVPEPRLGGRLRLNAFCGLNLASHALGLNGRAFSWLFADPSAETDGDLKALFAGDRRAGHIAAHPSQAARDAGEAVVEAVAGKRIARIGDHPAGFDTCAYRPEAVLALAGVSVDALPLADLFDAARAAPAEAGREVGAALNGVVSGLDAVDAAELDRSLRLKAGLDAIRARGAYDAFAIRCWPEAFSEYGGAVCGPVSMLGEARVPCACEADVYGALTQLILQEAAGAPVFLTDLVDIDRADDSAVVWHCGQAPLSMRDPDTPARATIHTNRKMPLLMEFPLKPGPVTLMRIFQAFNEPKMVVARAEVLKRPMAFTGTSGVLRFARPAGEMLEAVISSGLEHHMALAYGDHMPMLRSTAAALDLPLLEL